MALTPHPEKILLIQFRRLGDVVLTTALAADLRKAYPHARIDFMVGSAAAPLLLHNPDISNVILFDPKRLGQSIGAVRSTGYDILIDVQAHPKTALLTRFSGAPVRVGWNARFWGLVYTHKAARDVHPMYVVRNRQRLLGLLGIAYGDTLPRLYLTDAERQQAARDAVDLGLASNLPTVGIALGTHDPARDWRIDGFAAVTEELSRRQLNVLIFRFPGDDDIIAEFRRHTATGVIAPWNGDRRFLPLLARCATLISPNTGPSHMALALGVPRVTIYGSTNSDLWDPGLPTTIALNNPRQACLGCGKSVCPVDRACIRGIKHEEVVHAVLQLLT